jgi:hypothetical protein
MALSQRQVNAYYEAVLGQNRQLWQSIQQLNILAEQFQAGGYARAEEGLPDGTVNYDGYTKAQIQFLLFVVLPAMRSALINQEEGQTQTNARGIVDLL